jgi:hypothetical protein
MESRAFRTFFGPKSSGIHHNPFFLTLGGISRLIDLKSWHSTSQPRCYAINHIPTEISRGINASYLLICLSHRPEEWSSHTRMNSETFLVLDHSPNPFLSCYQSFLVFPFPLVFSSVLLILLHGIVLVVKSNLYCISQLTQSAPFEIFRDLSPVIDRHCDSGHEISSITRL